MNKKILYFDYFISKCYTGDNLDVIKAHNILFLCCLYDKSLIEIFDKFYIIPHGASEIDLLPKAYYSLKDKSITIDNNINYNYDELDPVIKRKIDKGIYNINSILNYSTYDTIEYVRRRDIWKIVFYHNKRINIYKTLVTPELLNSLHVHDNFCENETTEYYKTPFLF